MKNLTSRRWIAARAVCALAMAALAGAGSVRAGTLAVTSLNDNGPGSLREAIISAVSGDTIILSVTGTITLTRGALTVDKDLEIQGPGPKKLKISGNHASRVFFIASGEVTLAGMTISDGLADANTPVLPSTGGGISNYGSLILSNVVVSGNQALGDRTLSPLGYPGLAGGGGIANFGVLAVVDCSFIGNLVRGGDGSVSLNPSFLAGLGYGGAISHVAAVSLTVTGSTFRQNQAIGGSGCFSPILSGHGSGGAIGSQAAVTVSDSRFDHNLALAGENNATVLPYGFGPNKATAGAINISGGTAAIDGCAFEHNQAIGGAGGIGSGGAIVVTDVVGQGGNTTINNSTVAHNHAQGGEAEFGGSGGNGLGGGFYEDAGRTAPLVPGSSTLALEGTLVTFNLALGGEASDAGSDGQGIGGGVYSLGSFSTDGATVINKNHASTIGDNVSP